MRLRRNGKIPQSSSSRIGGFFSTIPETGSAFLLSKATHAIFTPKILINGINKCLTVSVIN